MRQLSRFASAVAITAAVTVAGPTAMSLQRPDRQPNADALILQDFRTRIDAYMTLHRRAVKDSPPLTESTDPAQIKAARKALAARIQAAHAGARPGDIFTAAVSGLFRRLLAPEMKGPHGADHRAILKDDAPAPAEIPFKVNAPYPEGVPFPTVPVNLLRNLPPLPEELEYRIVGQHLILRDVQANLIADYMLNVIQ